MRLLWLADVLRAAGLAVIEHPGWQTRGRHDITVHGVVCHHTASSRRATDRAVARLLANGRADLAGPLSQLGLQRDGTFVVIAAGRANHNGYGQWGNDSIGIEAYNDGVGEPWPAVQLDAYQRGCAAILARCGLPASRCKGHRETDPDRKIDPTGIDMDAFRARVAALMADPMEDDMAQQVNFYAPLDPDDEASNHAYLVTNNVGKYLPTAEAIGLCSALGIPRGNQPDQPLDSTWQSVTILVDGPCRNTP